MEINALELFNKVYPVGSIYMSVNSTNPSNLFGGTWVAWGSGRVPVGINTSDTSFNTVEKTGGNKTHAITASEMPSHTHSYKDYYGYSGGDLLTYGRGGGERAWYAPSRTGTSNSTGGSGSHTHSLSSTSHTHTITPPYYTLIYLVN